MGSTAEHVVRHAPCPVLIYVNVNATLSAANQVQLTGPTKPGAPARALETASGCPRDFLEYRFVYVVISPRARGLSIGLNVNPDKCCNFDCVYCEVDRRVPPRESVLDVEAMASELQLTLEVVRSGAIRQRPCYAALPAELLPPSPLPPGASI